MFSIIEINNKDKRRHNVKRRARLTVKFWGGFASFEDCGSGEQDQTIVQNIKDE